MSSPVSSPPKIDTKRVYRGNTGKGRPKGSPNKTTKAVKEMILAALGELGGEEYLIAQGKENPVAFMTLLGRIIPSEVKMDTKPLFQFVNVLPPELPPGNLDSDLSLPEKESHVPGD
jgi:hypothetical protein